MRDDLISRKAAIDSIGKCTDIYVNNLPTMIDKAEAYKALNELPSAQPEPHWIPISEKLPEIGKEVLLSEPNVMFIAEYHGAGDPEGLWLVDRLHHYLADVNGCAWMPFPNPYRGESE